MSQSLVKDRKFRREIPAKHKRSLDTRLQWLFNQRFGSVQNIYKHSQDVLDHTAATMILQCVLAEDLISIRLLYQRLEGGAVADQERMERDDGMRI